MTYAQLEKFVGKRVVLRLRDGSVLGANGTLTVEKVERSIGVVLTGRGNSRQAVAVRNVLAVTEFAQ